VAGENPTAFATTQGPLLGMRTAGLALSLALTAPTITAAEMRTFTDTSGRTMAGEVLEATETTVRIRRDDDRVFELALDTLTETDRAHIAAWRLKRALAFGGIEISAHRVRLDSDLTQTRSSTRKPKTGATGFSIATTRASISRDYRGSCTASTSSTTTSKPIARRCPWCAKTGRATIGDLSAGATAELQTTVVTLKKIQLKPGHRHSGTSRRKAEDSLAGLWVRVFTKAKSCRNSPARRP